MPRLSLAIPNRPGESPLDTIPFILGATDCVLSVLEIAGVMELAIALGVVTGPLAAAVGSFMSLGAGYDEAKRDIEWDQQSRGFSRGVVMGADNVGARKAASYFGHEHFARNPFLEGGAQVATDAYKKGLLSGYFQGRALSEKQRLILWKDLLIRGKPMPGWSDFSGQSSASKHWPQRKWIDYYIFFAAVFRKFHMSGA